MNELVRRCQFFNCGVRGREVEFYHIFDRVYAYLCVGHANMALNARHSTVALIEFLISMKGDSREYRDRMRTFVIQEVQREVDGR